MSGWNGGIAIVGIGEAGVGRANGKSSFALLAEAADAALADAGLSLDAIDGIVSPNSLTDTRLRYAQSVAEYLGMSAESLRYVLTDALGGAASGQSIHNAAMSILSGYATNVLVVGGDALRSASIAASPQERMAEVMGHEFEVPYGLSPVAFFALMTRRYMHDYQVQPESLAGVAAQLRLYAADNPVAHCHGQRPTVSDVLSSRLISDPIHLLECALVSDGAAALVLTSAQSAAVARKKPVFIKGRSIAFGSGYGKVHEHMSQVEDLYTPRTASRASSARALTEAGLTREGIDVAFVYDAFPILPSLFVEGLGYAPDGKGAEFIAAGNTAIDGAIPVNTHGGLMGYCHCGYAGGMFMFTEAVRQLRGDAFCQVPAAKTALIQGYGSHVSRFPTTILGVEA
ncbi:MAG: thiolase family protein [Dehalococcoidia bacterium]